MPVLPGAEPYRHEGGEVGVLLCHGFTGSPQSLRPWAEYLAERGLTVSLPLLPGHGTRWQDMQITGWQDWYAEVGPGTAGAARALRPGLRLRPVDGWRAGAAAGREARRQRSAASSWSIPRTRCTARGARPARGPASGAVRARASPATSPRRAATEIGLRPGAAARSALAAPLLPAGRRRAAAGDPAAAAAAQPAGPCGAAGRLGARPEPVSRRRTSTETLLEHSYHVATLDHDAERIFEKSTRSSAGSLRAPG